MENIWESIFFHNFCYLGKLTTSGTAHAPTQNSRLELSKLWANLMSIERCGDKLYIFQ